MKHLGEYHDLYVQSNAFMLADLLAIKSPKTETLMNKSVY